MSFEWLTRLNTEILALIDLGLMLLAWRFGFFNGRRRVAREDGSTAHANGVAQSTLALLSLLLAFTYGTTYSKYEERRVDIVLEANTISTFATRLMLLPDALRDESLEHLRQYVQLHRQIVRPSTSQHERRAIDRQLRDQQDWFVRTVTTYLKTPAGASLSLSMMPALNAMLDQYESRLNDVRARVPAAVLLLLLSLSVVSAFFIGRAEGCSWERPRHVTLVVFFILSIVLYVSLDMDQPWRGLTRVSEVPIDRVAEGLGIR